MRRKMTSERKERMGCKKSFENGNEGMREEGRG